MVGNNYLSDSKNLFFSLEDDFDDKSLHHLGLIIIIMKTMIMNLNENIKFNLLQRRKNMEGRTTKSSQHSISK